MFFLWLPTSYEEVSPSEVKCSSVFQSLPNHIKVFGIYSEHYEKDFKQRETFL